MKITPYNEKLCFLNLDETSEFLDIRAAGYVKPDANYRPGEVPNGYLLMECIFSGHARFYSSNAAHDLRQGDLLIQRTPEGWHYECDAASPIGKLWMAVRGRYIDSLIALYQLSDAVTVIRAPECFPIMRRMVDDLSDFGVRELELCHMLLDLFDAAFAPPRNEPTLPMAERIRNVLDRHIEKPVKISDVAGYFCKSSRQIERIFEEHFGVSVYSYLRDRRFAAACRELRRTGELVNVIARRFQLGSPSYFAREFVKRFGMTPVEYREYFRKGSMPDPGYAGNPTIYDYIPFAGSNGEIG